MDITRTVTTDATGTLIIEFNVKDLYTLLINFDSAAYWGFNDLTAALSPIQAQQNLAMDWQSFPNQARQGAGKIIRIYAKRQTAGTLNCVVSLIGAT